MTVLCSLSLSLSLLYIYIYMKREKSVWRNDNRLRECTRHFSNSGSGLIAHFLLSHLSFEIDEGFDRILALGTKNVLTVQFRKVFALYFVKNSLIGKIESTVVMQHPVFMSFRFESLFSHCIYQTTKETHFIKNTHFLNGLKLIKIRDCLLWTFLLTGTVLHVPQH